MEKKKKTKIQKWDEVGGAVETEIEEVAGSFDETPGAGPSMSRNPMRGIEEKKDSLAPPGERVRGEGIRPHYLSDDACHRFNSPSATCWSIRLSSSSVKRRFSSAAPFARPSTCAGSTP